jgi:hypothetical protein
MSTLTRLMLPLRRAAQAFFQRDVKLQREDGGVRLLLADRCAAPAARVQTAAERLAEKQKLELQLMLGQLQDVLDKDQVAQRLAGLGHFVEHALKKKGLKALRRMPLDVLRRALDQFEGLVTNWSPEGLANLRSKMAVTVIDRETDPGMTEPGGLDSVFSPSQIEAVLDPPRIAAEKAIEAARESAFADSMIERLALEFGVARKPLDKTAVEMQGELNSPSARSLGRGPDAGRGTGRPGDIELRDLQT